MRKVLISAAAVLAVAVAILPTAFAGKWVTNQKVPFYAVSACSSDNVLTAGSERGFAQLVDPMGSVGLIVNGHVTGLTPTSNFEV